MCSKCKVIKGPIIQWQQDRQSGGFQWEANVFTAACLPNTFRLSQAVKFGSLAGRWQWASVWYTVGRSWETYAEQSWLLFQKTMTWFREMGFSCVHVSFHTVRSLWSLHYLFHPAWDQKDRPSQARLQSASAWAQEHHRTGLPLQSQPALLDRRGGGQDLSWQTVWKWRWETVTENTDVCMVILAQ